MVYPRLELIERLAKELPVQPNRQLLFVSRYRKASRGEEK